MLPSLNGNLLSMKSVLVTLATSASGDRKNDGRLFPLEEVLIVVVVFETTQRSTQARP